MLKLLIDFDIIFLISFIATIILVVLLGYREIKYRHQHKKLTPNHNINQVTKENPEQIEEIHETLRMEDLRNTGYHGFKNLSNVDNNTFFIDEDEYEAFGIFMHVVPDILTALSRLEKLVLLIDHLFDDPSSDKQELSNRMTNVQTSLQTITDASNQLLDKMYEIYINSSIDTVEIEIDPKLIKGYIQTIDGIFEFAFGYLQINNEIRQKIIKRDQQFENEFISVSNKFLYIFFADLMNCVSMLDKSIVIYKKGN